MDIATKDELSNVDQAIKSCLAKFSAKKKAEWKKRFAEEGVVNVSAILPEEMWAVLDAEAKRLAENDGVARDITIGETDNTPRKMITVGNSACREKGQIIPRIYDSEVFREFLSDIAGENVNQCPIVDEQIAISLLTEPGNTHGWHWDDFSFGLVWIIESPDPNDGGFTQCIPNTVWNKKTPNVLKTIVENPIRSYSFPVGSFYFFRSGTTLHRVHPLIKKTRRLIVNMDWASDADLSREVDISTTSEIYGS